MCNKCEITAVRKHLVSLARGVADGENRESEPGSRGWGRIRDSSDRTQRCICMHSRFPTNNALGNAQRNARLNIYQLIPRVTQFELR